MADEGRMDVGDLGTVSPKIEIMTRALIDLFGDRAREVSERQATLGDNAEAVAIWRQIVEQVGRLRP